jgi:hypothetical protein
MQLEVAGQKFEFSEPQVTRVETLKLGDTVKILVKEGYPPDRKSVVHPGIVVGFEPFKDLPTVLVAYLDLGYNGGIKTIAFNAESVDTQMVKAIGDFSRDLNVSVVREKLYGAVTKAEVALADARHQLELFDERFAKFCGEVVR